MRLQTEIITGDHLFIVCECSPVPSLFRRAMYIISRCCCCCDVTQETEFKRRDYDGQWKETSEKSHRPWWLHFIRCSDGGDCLIVAPHWLIVRGKNWKKQNKKQVKKLFFCAARRIAFRHCVAIRRGERDNNSQSPLKKGMKERKRP